MTGCHSTLLLLPPLLPLYIQVDRAIKVADRRDEQQRLTALPNTAERGSLTSGLGPHRELTLQRSIIDFHPTF